MTSRTGWNTVLLIALAGIAVSLYSFLHNQGISSGEFCSINEDFNCDVVNKGPYGYFFGIPVSLIGLIGYGFLFIASWQKRGHIGDKQLGLFIVMSAGAGLLFSFYLTYIEAFVLSAWCLLCITSQVLILAAFALTMALYLKERYEKK